MNIQINKLVKIYGDKTVLNIPDLLIGSGELVGLVGNNGAGKTTMLRLILDLIHADEGYVMSNDMKVNENFDWKTYTGSFIDGRFLIDFYTPEEYFSFIGNVYKISPDIIKSRLEEYAPMMHDEILGTKKYIKDFSEGNRQKIGIIGAMIINPKVLLLDEPFNFLDPSSQIIVATLIKKMNSDLGTTVLISSHNLNFVSEISSRILLLEKGELIKDLNNQDGIAEKELTDYFASQA
jgi:ABC-2 type transport system ATP-binding protein